MRVEYHDEAVDEIFKQLSISANKARICQNACSKI